ncbi:uncharacterized protein LOC141640524 [Silene latifolia]|uniref:uncharacterized protein LOC141640524 n=1 Tax=Silene latifolia TaxID=37657 RepID=UPI003D781E86
MGSIGFWNIRGMNSSKKQYEIKRFLSQNNVGLFGLLETKIKANNWNKLNIIDIIAQCIHAEVFDKVRKKMFWITMIYGFNKPVERESLWLSLKGYHQSINGPWMTCGDFNSVMAIDERIGGGPVSLADIRPLQQVVQDFLKKLLWLGNLLLSISTCGPRLIILRRLLLATGSLRYMVPPMFQIVTKLKRLKGGLKALNKDQFSDIEKLTHVTELALLRFQTLLCEDPLNDGLCKAEKACAQEVVWMHQVRDEYLQQKAKVQWVLDGDDNTAYFHASIRKRKSRNKVYQVTKVNKRVVLAGNCLNSQHCELLMSPVTSEEIKSQEVCSAIKNVFHTGQLLKQCNNTVITLVPKVELPDNVKQFRPIACCNTFYKCLSKVLCTRLSKILPDIMMNYLGFPELWIKLIMQCISTSSYSIALNGETFGFFKGKRGLRQGDPLSPLLFTLCLEYFSRILAVTQQQHNFRFHPLCKRIGLSHLCFADDLILFCKGEKTSIELMINSFDYFSKASGLVLNTGKSNFYCNGMEDWLISEIARATGMKKGSAPFKYLGVDVAPKRLLVLDCSCLVDKVVERINGLGARHLSYAGRLVLVKAVFNTLHNYWARIFILPKVVIQKIEPICRAFL